LAGDDVHHRRLPGAVGADDAAKLARVDRERKVVKRLEAVEADRDAVEVENAAMSRVDAFGEDPRAGRDRIVPLLASRCGAPVFDSRMRAAHSPALPRGRNSVTRMNSSPSANSQYSGKAFVNQLLPRLTAAAPSTGPISVPRPPTAVQIAISIEFAGDISLGLMIPTCGT